MGVIARMGVIATCESSRRLPEFSIPAQVANALLQGGHLPCLQKVKSTSEWKREPSATRTGTTLGPA